MTLAHDTTGNRNLSKSFVIVIEALDNKEEGFIN